MSDFAFDVYSGAFVVDSRGDIGVHSGRDAILERAIRFVTTQRGAFYHLPGWGLDVRIKKLSTTSRTAELQVDILQGLREDEDISDLEVEIDRDRGYLLISISGTLADGQAVDLKLTRTPEGDVIVA